MTVQDAHKDNENDILTDDILQLKDIFQKKEKNAYSPNVETIRKE